MGGCGGGTGRADRLRGSGRGQADAGADAVIRDMTEAVTVMNEAVEKMSVVSLPDEFRDAAGQAENCAT